MPSVDGGKLSVWKERREWLAAILGVIGLSISIGAYLLSRSSATSNKSLILVAEKASDPDGALGLSFVFHPLNQGQKISSISIIFPPVISTASQIAVPLTQEIDLSVEAIAVEHFVSTRYPRSQRATIVTWDGNIPVILEARYVYTDENLTHRGIYMLPTHIVWRESGRPFDVQFRDVVFSRSIGERTDYGQALTDALVAEEQARRKLFDPTH
jgi:hypothetical protein